MKRNTSSNPVVAAGWRAEEITAWRGYAPEWIGDRKLLFASGRQICETSDCGVPLRPVAKFPLPRWLAAASAFRPSQRLLRLMYYNVIPTTDDSLIASFGKRVAVLRGGEFDAVSGLRRASRILRGGCARTDDNAMFFGEYFDNRGREEVHVYRLDPASSASQVAHCFRPRSIRHVHGVYRDPYTTDLWCLTGDRGRECQMLRTRDCFSTLDVVGTGDESWRAVSIQFTEDAIVYGTDAEFSQNCMYRIDRRTGDRELLGPINGPVYYSCRDGSDLFFAVAAEACPSHTDRCAALWCVTNTCRLERVVTLKKDRWHTKYFMPGTLHFPAGPGIAGRIYFHAVGLSGADNRTFCLRRAA